MRPMPELEVVIVATDDLIEYENNANTHTSEQVDQIASSIQEFGFNSPILAWHDDDGRPVIVAGHGRLMAARSLGLQELPVVFVDHMTDEQRRAFGLVENKLTRLSEFDWDALERELLGIGGIDMAEYGFDVPIDLDGNGLEGELEPITADEDELPDISPTRVKQGQIWALGDHRLACGDSTDPSVIDALMGEEQADMLLTDPPYNVDYAEKNDHLVSAGRGAEHDEIANDSFVTDDDYRRFLSKSIGAMFPHLKSGGAFYIWYASQFVTEVTNACKDSGLQVRQCLYWVKNRIVLGRQDYQWQTEPCLYGWKDGTHWFAPTRKEHNVIDDMADIRKMDKVQLIELVESLMLNNEETDALRDDKPQKSAEHPTMKPVNLFARLIRNSTKNGETVLDTFAGSGTTAIACEQMGRKARMVELSEGYCDVIIERWERFTGKTAEPIGMVE